MQLDLGNIAHWELIFSSFGSWLTLMAAGLIGSHDSVLLIFRLLGVCLLDSGLLTLAYHDIWDSNLYPMEFETLELLERVALSECLFLVK
jgi:hypothetical protein